MRRGSGSSAQEVRKEANCQVLATPYVDSLQATGRSLADRVNRRPVVRRSAPGGGVNRDPAVPRLAPFGSSMLFYVFDLMGVAVFAVSGALAASRKALDLFGVLVIAAIAAIGGGTLRDLLLDRHPIFWMLDPTYLVVISIAALLTAGYLRHRPAPGRALLVADSLGLALFAISGARIAEAAGHASIIVILLGTMTGVAGGVLRDVLSAEVPLILQRDIYATAAIAGISVYLLLQWLGVPQPAASVVGMVAVVALRLVAIVRGLGLPVIRLPEEHSPRP